MRQKLLLALLTMLFIDLAQALPPWTYTITGTNHTIIIDTSAHPTFNGLPLSAGDYIGVFYNSDGTLACGGYEMWTGTGAIAVAAFGTDHTWGTRNGFAVGETFTWMIWRQSDGRVASAEATYLPVGGIITNTDEYAMNGISSLSSLTGLGQYLINSSAGLNGTISPVDIDTVLFGGSQSFTVTPAMGYHLDSLIVDGLPVDSTSGYTFTAVNADHTIRAVFKINSYTITATAEANGTITPSGEVNVNYGANRQFIITPNTGYHIDSVLVDGLSVGPTSSFTFRSVDTNHTIRAVFKINSYTITASASAGGTITPSGNVIVDYGASQQFVATPGTGYHIDSILVDGVRVDSMTSYTFTGVTSSHAIRAMFTINSYLITATAGPNGTITPSGTVNVNYGAKQHFSITPSTGYHVDTLLVDGLKVDSTTSYTFTAVDTGHTILAVFKINSYTITSTAGANGMITPSGTVNLNYGASQQYIVAPGTGYHVDTLLVDGLKVDSTTSYTFTALNANHTIRAVFKINSYPITATAVANGTITPSGTVNVNYGANQQFVVTPAVGYNIDSVIVDGSKVDSMVSYTFRNVTAPHTIRVTFLIKMYTITSFEQLHGTISPLGVIIINYGGSQAYTVTPDSGCRIDSVLVDGKNLGPLQAYTFTNVTGNHSIVGYFTESFSITATAGAHGTITPSGTVKVDYGSNQRFIIAPNTGYYIDSVLVDGLKVDSTVGYTFKNVTAPHTIRAAFKIRSFTITSFEQPHGTISPFGVVVLNYGGSQAYTVTPDSGCRIDSVLVDGRNLGPLQVYTFINVTGYHSIAAYFTQSFSITATAGANGTITPLGTVKVDYSTNKQFVIAPNTGYYIDSVLVDGLKVDSTVSYTFRNVSAAHTIRVVFHIKLFTITSFEQLHGTISPLGVVVISYGGSQAYIVTPDGASHIDSVLVDGKNLGPLLTYTFTHVVGYHSIAAYFSTGPGVFAVWANIGWNIVSVPLHPLNSHKAALYPSAKSVAFGYQGTYVIRDTLACGAGYWLKFDHDQALSLDGYILPAETLSVVQGWNLIGSLSYAIATGSIVSDPPGMITSRFFRYEGRYIIADTIQAGQGYWVKVNQSGLLFLSNTGSVAVASAGPERIIMSLADDMPPAPPEGDIGAPDLPKDFFLAESYPNPFNPTATIDYDLPSESRVLLNVYNLLGQFVVTLTNGIEEAGYKSIQWNASNFGSGIYFYSIEATSVTDPSKTFTQVRKMVLLK